MPTINKLFGVADPQYDALRVLSTQALEAGPGSGEALPGGGLTNSIYVWHADASTLGVYDPDEAGLIAAIAGAATGDTIWLPSVPIAMTAAITVPANVALVGISHKSILSFSGFSGTAVTLSNASIIYGITVNMVSNGSTAIGITAYVADSRVIDVVVNASGGTLTNIAIGAGAAIAADEIWAAGDNSTTHVDRFIAWSEDQGATWTLVASLPEAGQIINFDGFHDGSAIFVQMNTDKQIYKCENPKDAVPIWTSIIEEGDSIGGGVTVANYFGLTLSKMRCVGDTFYVSVYGSDSNVYAATYTLAGGWTFTIIGTVAGGVDADAQILQGYYTKSIGGSPNQYSLIQIGGGTLNSWAQAKGFSDSTGQLWRNLIAGHFYCERGVNATPALYYFHDIDAGTDVIGDEFDTRLTNEGYLNVARPRGAWYGSQVYVVDPENGDLYIAEDGATFGVVETWVDGLVMDDILVGGGNLFWMRKALVIAEPAIQMSADGGATWSDATGDFLTVIPAVTNVGIFNMFLVWRS